MGRVQWLGLNGNEFVLLLLSVDLTVLQLLVVDGDCALAEEL